MYRAAAIVICALLLPASVAAQQPCTTNARQVVRELYRHMLERQPDAAAAGWVRQLESGQTTVRDVVLAIASSPEYSERFIYQAGGRMPYKESVAIDCDDEDVEIQREVLRTAIAVLDLTNGELELVGQDSCPSAAPARPAA